MIEPIINSFCVKYVTLDKEVSSNITNGSEINIYINLESVFQYFYTKIFSEYIDKNINPSNEYCVAPLLLNIAAHYRHYFASRYNVPSKIVFYRGMSLPINNITYLPEYNLPKLTTIGSDNMNGVNVFINKSIAVFSKLVNYIQDVYYVAVDNVECSLIPYHIIDRFDSNKTIHLTITRDGNDLQLTSLHNSFVLHVNKDKSKIVSKDNIVESISQFTNSDFKPDIKLDCNFLSLIYAQSGLKSRHVKGIKGSGFITATKRIVDKINKGFLVNSRNKDIELVCDILGFSTQTSEQVTNNFKAVDLDFQYMLLDEYKKKLIDSDMSVNIYNNEDLMYLNEHYFKLYEFNLIYLEELVKRSV